jgi:hypothetical protein
MAMCYKYHKGILNAWDPKNRNGFFTMSSWSLKPLCLDWYNQVCWHGDRYTWWPWHEEFEASIQSPRYAIKVMLLSPISSLDHLSLSSTTRTTYVWRLSPQIRDQIFLTVLLHGLYPPFNHVWEQHFRTPSNSDSESWTPKRTRDHKRRLVILSASGTALWKLDWNSTLFFLPSGLTLRPFFITSLCPWQRLMQITALIPGSI